MRDGAAAVAVISRAMRRKPSFPAGMTSQVSPRAGDPSVQSGKAERSSIHAVNKRGGKILHQREPDCMVDECAFDHVRCKGLDRSTGISRPWVSGAGITVYT